MPGTSRSPRTPKNKQQPSPRSGSSRRKGSAPRRSGNQPTTSRATISTRRRRRYRPGVKALKEIKELQKSTALCIKKLPFSRLVREIQYKQNPRITHWQTDAIAALQEAAEAYIVRFLEDCNDAAHFSNRVTIMKRDLQFINMLRGRNK